MRHVTEFLLELGAGFAFVGRQVLLEVGGDEFFIDLLFYHLKLRCYVVIELKGGKFKPEHLGQLSFYLTAVDAQVEAPEQDGPTIGLLLCKSKNNVVAEYALRDSNKPIGVAEYQLVKSLPPSCRPACRASSRSSVSWQTCLTLTRVRHDAMPDRAARGQLQGLCRHATHSAEAHHADLWPQQRGQVQLHPQPSARRTRPISAARNAAVAASTCITRTSAAVPSTWAASASMCTAGKLNKRVEWGAELEGVGAGTLPNDWRNCWRRWTPWR